MTPLSNAAMTLNPLYGSTPLSRMNEWKNKPEVAKILLDHGADSVNLRTSVNFRQPAGNTPLHTSAYYGSWRVAKLILDKNSGAVEVLNNRGETPLDLAIIQRDSGLILASILKSILNELRHRF